MIPDYVRVATVGGPHGLAGDVKLRLHTDDPAGRLVVGTRFPTEPAHAGPLELARVVEHSGATHARFVGYPDRTAVERLRGVVLLAEAVAEDDAWYPDQLVGLTVRRPDGTGIGAVVAVEHPPAHDVLVVMEPGGHRTRVPFVEAIVPTVDVEGGFVVVDAPAGLLAADRPEDGE